MFYVLGLKKSKSLDRSNESACRSRCKSEPGECSVLDNNARAAVVIVFQCRSTPAVSVSWNNL